ncbi:MAG: hypothetical protein U1F11_12000 [Steroidobacteraceae bacterium]
MDPAARLSSALQVREWSRAAEPTLAASEAIGADLARLEACAQLLADAAAQAPRLDLLGRAGPRIAVRLLCLTAREPSPPVVPDVPQQTLAADGHHYLLLAGETAMVETLERSWLARHAEAIALPPWLPAEPQRALEQLRVKSGALERHQREPLEQLSRQSRRRASSMRRARRCSPNGS